MLLGRIDDSLEGPTSLGWFAKARLPSFCKFRGYEVKLGDVPPWYEPRIQHMQWRKTPGNLPAVMVLSVRAYVGFMMQKYPGPMVDDTKCRNNQSECLGNSDRAKYLQAAVIPFRV